MVEFAQDIDVDDALANAQRAVAAWEARVGGRRLVRRLAAEKPGHPVVIALRVLPLVSGGLAVFSTVGFLAVALSSSAAQWLLAVPGGELLPPLGMLLAVWTATGVPLAHHLGQLRGASSPLMADEDRTYQRLVGEVARLQTMARLEEERQARAA